MNNRGEKYLHVKVKSSSDGRTFEGTIPVRESEREAAGSAWSQLRHCRFADGGESTLSLLANIRDILERELKAAEEKAEAGEETKASDQRCPKCGGADMAFSLLSPEDMFCNTCDSRNNRGQTATAHPVMDKVHIITVD